MSTHTKSKECKCNYDRYGSDEKNHPKPIASNLVMTEKFRH
jgi:hypothetical protein